MKKLSIARNKICLYAKLASLFGSYPEKEKSIYSSGFTPKPFFPEQMPAGCLLDGTSNATPEQPVYPYTENDKRSRQTGILRSTVFFYWKELA
jgi:hypothetical protein